MFKGVYYGLSASRSRSNKVNEDNLIKYFIKKYTNTGDNIGPTINDIPDSEKDDYNMVFNSDGSIKEDCLGTDYDTVSMDELLDNIKNRNYFLV